MFVKSALCQKTKKYRKRTAAPDKLNPLKLIFINICGPLPNGINGSRYFLEIINNYTRKSDAIPLKTKSQTIPELSKWRKAVQCYTKYKLTIDKSDNAPELKQVLKDWAAKDGIHINLTTTYTSS